MTKEFSSQYWDRIVNKFNGHYRSKCRAEHHRYENEELFNEWELNFKYKNILVTDLFNEAFNRNELPCGLWEADALIVGMDISRFVVKKFNENYSKLKKLVCDVRYLPFKDNTFDIIISPSTLDHFYIQDCIISLREIRRVLKNKGNLILFLHNKHNIFFYFYFIKMLRLLPFHLELYSKKQVVRILKENKFYISNCTATDHIFLPMLYPLVLSWLTKSNLWKIHDLIISRINNFTKLRDWPTKYLTGIFIVIRAIK